MPGREGIRFLACLMAIPLVSAVAGCGSQVVGPGPGSPLPPAATRSAPARADAAPSPAAKRFDDVPAVPAASVLELPPPAAARYHEVKPGETLSGIARRYGTSAGALVEANGLDAAAPIQPGQLIYIP